MNNKAKGFTIIEVTLAILLISILIAITTPLVSNVVGRADLNSAHESLYNAILKAQSLSKIQYRSQQWRVCIDNTAKQYIITAGTCASTLYPETIKFSSNITVSSTQTLDLAFTSPKGELNYAGNFSKITLSSGGVNKSILINKTGMIDKAATSDPVYTQSIVTNGLVLNLDAGNPSSYSGIGTTWRDLSGGDRNYTIGSGISWNNIGYFDVAGGSFIGPASNTFGFSTNNEHTIEVFARSNTTTANTFFYWAATPNTGSDQRAISTHLYSTYSGLTYYDVNGCCGTTQRISYSNDNDLSAGVRYLVWRSRTGVTPNRQFLKNLVSQIDSGVNSTATVTWNRTDSAGIGGGWSGELYLFRVYNRALSDSELQQNFNANRGRFGL